MPADQLPGLFVFSPAFSRHHFFGAAGFNACAIADLDGFLSRRIDSALKLAAADQELRRLQAQERPLNDRFLLLYQNPTDEQRQERIWVGEQLARVLKLESKQQQIIADTLGSEIAAAKDLSAGH